MTLLEKISNKILILKRKKNYYFMHYIMWDFIAIHLLYDSDELLNATNYIHRLKKTFLELNNCGDIYRDCFLCELYFGTQEKGCAGCPIYDKYSIACTSDDSLLHIVYNKFNKRDKRIKAAKMIRDCTLRKKRNRK